MNTNEGQCLHGNIHLLQLKPSISASMHKSIKETASGYKVLKMNFANLLSNISLPVGTTVQVLL